VGILESLAEASVALQRSPGKALAAVEGLVHLGSQAVEVVGTLAVRLVGA